MLRLSRHIFYILCKETIVYRKFRLFTMVAGGWRRCRRLTSLTHEPAWQFARCQWQRSSYPSIVYLIYRLALVAFFASVATACFLLQSARLPESVDIYRRQVLFNKWKWFIYLTNWGYLFCLVQSVLAFVILYDFWAEGKPFPTASPSSCDPWPERRAWSARARSGRLHRAYWITHTIATDLAFVITAVYWTIVHDPKIHTVDALNLLVHGANSGLMLLELALTSHPMRAAHAFLPLGVGATYGAFSAVYWVLGGTDRLGAPAIYPPLNWNKPTQAVTFVAACAGLLCAAHGVTLMLQKLRSRLFERVIGSEESVRIDPLSDGAGKVLSVSITMGE